MGHAKPLVAMLPLLVSTLCTAPFLTVIPVTAVRLKAFAPFWRAQLREAEAQAHGVELGVAVEVEAGDDLVGDVRLVAEQFVAVQRSRPRFVLLALIVGEHGFHVPLVVDQQAEASGSNSMSQGSSRLISGNMSCPILQNWLK